MSWRSRLGGNRRTNHSMVVTADHLSVLLSVLLQGTASPGLQARTRSVRLLHLTGDRAFAWSVSGLRYGRKPSSQSLATSSWSTVSAGQAASTKEGLAWCSYQRGWGKRRPTAVDVDQSSCFMGRTTILLFLRRRGFVAPARVVGSGTRHDRSCLQPSRSS